jgi:hypothetical protein
VLPSITSTGGYSINSTTSLNENIFNVPLPPPSIDKVAQKAAIRTESDLHYAVVEFIRKRYPGIHICPGLGENQKTPQIRIDSYCKGYIKGAPDLIIPYQHVTYCGIAIELKTPAGCGIIKKEQIEYLQYLKDVSKYKILVSNDYDYIVESLIEFFKEGRLKCPYCKDMCKNSYRTPETRNKHINCFHKNICENHKVTDDLVKLCDYITV